MPRSPNAAQYKDPKGKGDGLAGSKPRGGPLRTRGRPSLRGIQKERDHMPGTTAGGVVRTSIFPSIPPVRPSMRVSFTRHGQAAECFCPSCEAWWWWCLNTVFVQPIWGQDLFPGESVFLLGEGGRDIAAARRIGSMSRKKRFTERTAPVLVARKGFAGDSLIFKRMLESIWVSYLYRRNPPNIWVPPSVRDLEIPVEVRKCSSLKQKRRSRQFTDEQKRSRTEGPGRLVYLPNLAVRWFPSPVGESDSPGRSTERPPGPIDPDSRPPILLQ